MSAQPQSSQDQDKCPVDHKAQAAWLNTKSLQNAGTTQPETKSPISSQPATVKEVCPVDDTARQTWLNTQTLASGSPTAENTVRPLSQSGSLGKQREISTIPRAENSGYSNSEHTAASTGISSNWIYPSEEMFFNAMKRKAYDPQATDMRTIVPIHNAVNERAWAEIKKWEAGRGSEKCGGPKLASFAGESKKMTPKARLMVLLGYQAPFDRHDWVVDRCGKKIEYVIDFYAGKREEKRPESISFYLDVRPKLTFEGAVMRLQRWAKEFVS